MGKIYDDWERLVQSILRREQDRQLARIDSCSTTQSSEFGSSFGSSRQFSRDFSEPQFQYSYREIRQATDNFSKKNLINCGHSGDLFKGKLSNSSKFYQFTKQDQNLVVIKRIDLKLINGESYLSELDFLRKVSQLSFFTFLGCCLEKEGEKLLVYKYMNHRDLSTFLLRKDLKGDLVSLDWITRMKIAIGVAERLAYLHECTPSLVHGDMQASSVLLDHHFEVRLGSLSRSGPAQEMNDHLFSRDVQATSILLEDDFEVKLGSLSEVCAQEEETRGNRIPRLLRTLDAIASGTPKVTCAYDVYCFGKVLLELVTGNLGISSPSDPTTKEWLEETLRYISVHDKGLVTNIIDPLLIVDEDLLEEVWAMAIVSRSCLDPKPNRRPLMHDILKALENPLKVVREEDMSLRTTSSTGSWNASWQNNFSDVTAMPKVTFWRSRGK